ncbi:MAG: hypothetical protein WAP53_04545 [Dysgonamonadaceae bacterium]
MPHVERDPEEERERTFCKDGAWVRQAWSEDGAALVRRRCEESTTCPEINLR